MMRGLQSLGHDVALLTAAPTSASATDGLGDCPLFTFDQLPAASRVPALKWLEAKFCSYWGIPLERIGQVAELSASMAADAVVVVGLEVLPYLAAVQNAQRIWYAADEWVLHHYSQFSMTRPSSWDHVRPGMIKGLYERAFAKRVDRVWVVSPADRRATRWVMGNVAVDVIANGVDTAVFSPRTLPEIPNSCTFWGRLDFGPNIDAIAWFAKHVWRDVRTQVPDARWDVFGFNPTPAIHELSREYGFNVIANEPDIRDAVCQRQVVVLPFVTGAGIKNKLLEAASMARPIIASAAALNGLQDTTHAFEQAMSRQQWGNALVDLWNSTECRVSLGKRARQWASERHSWSHAAGLAVNSLSSIP